jgi:ComF family protein
MYRWLKDKLFTDVNKFLADVIFPPRCPLCDGLLEPEIVGSAYIHKECEKRLFFVGGSVCMHCGSPVDAGTEYCPDCGKKSLSESFRQGKALFLYRGGIQQTMYRFKYANKREYARFFAQTAVNSYGEWLKNKDIHLIVPVPMFALKQRKRGYNQAECFAKELSKELGIPMSARLVRRCKDTAPQKSLSDIERQKNLQDAFWCEEEGKNYKRVLVVDDIYTTGSTADAVTKKLLEAGVQEVYFLSVCIGGGS